MALVLLHGFTEDSSIWEPFTRRLVHDHRVVTIDLPGHGKSDIFGEVHSMDMMAEAVKCVLDRLKIKKSVMIGHSMGGYVTLSFAHKYPERIRGFGLFHSHAAADTDEVKINRERTINLIDKDKSGFIRDFIPLLFAPQNVDKYSTEILALKGSASRIDKRGLIAALAGMKDRREMTGFLKETDLPVLFIIGKHDSRISPDLALQHARLPKTSLILLLDNVGHMGFIEAKETTLDTVRSFMRIANS